METASEPRFVGIRMENGIKTVRTFGWALNARDQIAQVYAVVQNQRTVSQVWTGKTYRTSREAACDSERLNGAAVMEA